ncbi:hypothetical protein HNO92_002126 [Chromobacterium alkanivorans]|uniref:hypothetical protein n=1 Tax=Chromobacterium TaxID=535 RepID=UPI000653A083|nr:MULTISPECIES: hypothetical protein [Chromobacterium]KMN76261.1 hypothetical protein VK98_21960 [Chromobacterium sp. LK11]MBN3004401.1 hypothetical protein [Chromobacterium alkanivorans]MCS3805137.1 hypothetical protein [Chromobacterium alkanivorans]MCS3819300.1 hypothetical protein [Chromobacterium alkanivorans]MCS3873812.1 hypothetical protein [Chromobacterium alkanivorans]
MRKYLMIAVLALTSANLALADAACDAKAAEKKLAGAAKSSFLKKCEKDSAAANAQKSCDAKAADKKLAGAAKASFVKKCVKDAAPAK